MDSTATDPISRSLADIRARFVAELPSRRTDLEALIHDIETSADGIDRLQRARRIAHRIVGVAGTLGFPKLGSLAERAEDELASVPSRESERTVLAVEILCHAMQQVADQGRDCDDPVQFHPTAACQMQD